MISKSFVSYIILLLNVSFITANLRQGIFREISLEFGFRLSD